MKNHKHEPTSLHREFHFPVASQNMYHKFISPSTNSCRNSALLDSDPHIHSLSARHTGTCAARKRKLLLPSVLSAQQHRCSPGHRNRHWAPDKPAGHFRHLSQQNETLLHSGHKNSSQGPQFTARKHRRWSPMAPALQTAAKAQLSSQDAAAAAADSTANGCLSPARRHSQRRGGQAEEPT